MRVPRRIVQTALSTIALTALVSLSALPTAYAQSAVESILFTFPAVEQPSPLIQASDGNFYGTVSNDGANGDGYVFSLTPGGTLAIVYSFTGGADGGNPASSLMEGNDGNLYGTTNAGIFRLSFEGSLTVLHDSGDAQAPLIQDSAGDFFSVSGETIFEYSHDGVLSVVHTFTGSNGVGAAPNAPLLQASDGLIYGATNRGGTPPVVQNPPPCGPHAGTGTLFRFDPADSGTLTTFASFPYSIWPIAGAGPILSCPNPTSGLTEGADGLLNGTTTQGGTGFVESAPGGSIYSVTLGDVPSVNFSAQSFVDPNQGETPVGGLTLGGDGTLFGVTTTDGGEAQNGAVFGVGNSGGTLYSFPKGPRAQGPPIEGLDGNLYGVVGSEIYKLVVTPAIPTAITLTASASSITLGNSFTLEWQVNNAFSQTMQNCWAHGAWSGSKSLTGSQTFTPAATGTYTYALTCGGVESALTTVVVSLAPPTAVLSPATLTFPPTNIGSISGYQQVTLTNTGGSPLTFRGTSSDFPFFVPANHQLCSSTVAAGASCTFDVAFQPTAEGPVSGYIAVLDSASSSPQELQLSGIGRAAIVSLSTNNLTFPPTNVGSVSGYQQVTLTNTGNVTLTVGLITPVAGNAGNASQFFVPSDHQLCGRTLAAGASCTFDVAFKPTTEGSSNAIIFFDSIAFPPQELTLAGIGRAAILSLSTNNLTFPRTTVGSVSGYQQVTVTNTGNVTLNVTSVALTGPNASSFFLPANHQQCGSRLGAGASCTFDVAFEPTTVGPLSASILLTDDAVGGPQSIAVTGTGRPTATTTTLTFTPGYLVSGQSYTLGVAVAPTTGTAIPTGTVTLSSAAIAASPLTLTLDATGKAATTLTAPAPGDYSFSATYNGTPIFVSSATTFAEVVNSNTQVSGFAVYTIQQPNGHDQFATMTGTVTSGIGTVNGGTVTITSGFFGVGASAPVSSGQFSILIDLGIAPGPGGSGYALTLSYSGSGAFQASQGTATLVLNTPHGT